MDIRIIIVGTRSMLTLGEQHQLEVHSVLIPATASSSDS